MHDIIITVDKKRVTFSATTSKGEEWLQLYLANDTQDDVPETFISVVRFEMMKAGLRVEVIR